jgi:hypothetical protein
MALKEKLEKLKKLSEQHQELNWDTYKEVWQKNVSALYDTIQYKWFDEYEGLMAFSYFDVTRIEPYIGEYKIKALEIALSEQKILLLEPIAAITMEYDGKLEFYMRGNIQKKVSILRKITDEGNYKWVIAKSYNESYPDELNQQQFENLIDEWLQ